jgi:hypothetical protein
MNWIDALKSPVRPPAEVVEHIIRRNRGPIGEDGTAEGYVVGSATQKSFKVFDQPAREPVLGRRSRRDLRARLLPLYAALQ